MNPVFRQCARLSGCVVVISCLELHAAEIFVSPTGNDVATGTLAAPLQTPQAAVAKAQPGDVIYLRGGTYPLASTIQLTNSGTASARLTLAAYANETPVLNFTAWQPTNELVRAFSRGVLLAGNFWHLKGLEITGAPDNGIKVEGSHNVIENCVLHHNGDSGLQIGLTKKSKNDGSLVCSNLVLNCDSYRNFDINTKGENADGFACKLFPGPGNIFNGCRAWENADDGWDLFMTTYAVTIENCWAWHNGDASLFAALSSYNGDGNGFKLGGQNQPASHLVRNCIAFDNSRGNGFEDNNNDAPIQLQNCTAWDNRTNFEFKKFPHILKNCVAFDPVSARQDAKLEPMVVSDHNSWSPDPKKPTKFISTATRADFISLDVALAAAPRQADGSLPKNDFARLKPGSALIDKGVDVGIAFTGTAPDLGAFEFNP
jgi:hypothetical protein